MNSPLNSSSGTARGWTAGCRLIVVMAGLMLVQTIRASGVSLISDDRSVSASAQAPAGHASNPHSNSTDRPSACFTDPHLWAGSAVSWNDINGWTPAPTYGSAQQDAVLAPGQIGLNCLLYVSAGGDPRGVHCPSGAAGTAWASAVFDVRFSVSAPTQYTYLFDFDPTSTLVSANLLLISETDEAQQLTRTGGSPGSGILDPGIYTLHYDFTSRAVGTQAGYNASSFMFNFSSLPVPEPTGVTVILVGLLAIGVFRKQAGAGR